MIPAEISWILLAMISFGTCTSALAAASNGLVGVLTTEFLTRAGRVSGPWYAPTPSLPCWICPFKLLVFRKWFCFKELVHQYRWNIDVYYTLTSELMLQRNVCSLGCVIESNTLRSESVTSVSLSFPEPANLPFGCFVCVNVGSPWLKTDRPPARTGLACLIAR